MDFPNGVRVLTEWLKPLGIEVRDNRPTGAPLPFILVRRIGGGSDDLTDHGLYSVHSFAETATESYETAMAAHHRIRQLGGLYPVVLDGRNMWIDDVIAEGPEAVKIGNTLRYVGTYELPMRLQ